MRAASHPRQAARLAALRGYDVLDTPREDDFDDIVKLASQICGTPISVVNLIDVDRQWFKAEIGLGVRETPLDTSICSHAILEDEFVEIPDTLGDDRLRDNPLCVGEPGLRFYAGALLTTQEGLPLGTLCVLDYQPRRLNAEQRNALRVLGRQVMKQLDLRQALQRQKLLLKEIDHRVKNSLQSVSSMIRLQSRNATDEATRGFLGIVEKRIARIGLLHEHLAMSGVAGDRIDLAKYLTRLGEMLTPSLPAGVRLEIEAAPVLGDSTQAAALGVIVSEFAMNSAKHAFPDDRIGAIHIALRQGEQGVIALQCRDDGVGYKPATAPSGHGIGLRLIEASAAQLGSRVEIEPVDRGFALTVRLPGPV